MKKNIVVKQNDLRDCGACCLQSIIKFYGGYIPLEKIRLDTRTGNNGTTAYNIINAAKKYGFNAMGSKMETMHNDILPAIAHVVLNNHLTHFVVVYKIDKKYFYIMDPAKGIRKMKKEDFLKEWTKVILILKPYQQLPHYTPRNIIKDLFLTVLSSEKRIIFNILISSFIITLLSIILSYYLNFAISSLDSSFISSTIFMSLLFLFMTFLKILISYKREEYEIYLNKNINIKIIVPFIAHIVKLPLNVIKSRTPGEVITRINELNNIKDLFSEILITVILDLSLSVCTMYILYNLSSQLFFILCIIAIIYVIVGFIFNPLIYKRINDNIDLETEFNSELVEKISSMDTVKNLDITNKTINCLEDSYIKYLENSFDYSLFINKFNNIKNFINDIGLFLINCIGIFLIYNSEMSLIKLITFTSLLTYFISSIENSIDLLPKISLIKLSITKVNEFIALKHEEEGKKEKFKNGEIVFKNISYSYDDYHNLIDNFNINIKEKERIIIKGNSGTGKSTICRLLNRSLDGYKGKITINDIDIKDYSIKTIRHNIRYVSQKEKLFSDTIEKNILIEKKVSLSVLNEVLKITKVDEIIDKKPFRLNTLLIDSGSNVSGGERQRIVLARAIINKPKILILDESLSELNDTLEKEILYNVGQYLKDSTIIYISHHNDIPNYRVIRMNAID